MDKALLIEALDIGDDEKIALINYPKDKLSTRYCFNKRRLDEYICAYNNYVYFSFYSDDDYPQRMKENMNPPFCLSYVGSLDNIKPCIALIGDYICDDVFSYPAFEFSADLALNGVSIITGSGKGIEEAVRKGATVSNNDYFIALSEGILGFKARLGIVFSQDVSSKGNFLSLSSPFEKGSKEGVKRKIYLLSTLCEALVVFYSEKNRFIMDIVSDALNIGKDVFLHSSALSSKYGRKLMDDGIPVIDGISHFFDYYQMKAKKRMVFNDRGNIMYKSKRYELLFETDFF